MQWRKVNGEYTWWSPTTVRIELQDIYSRSAEFLVVIDEGTPDEISFVFDISQAGRSMASWLPRPCTSSSAMPATAT